jgi:hypothetical protein
MSKVSVFIVKITRLQYFEQIIITNHMGFEDRRDIQITKEIPYRIMYEHYF